MASTVQSNFVPGPDTGQSSVIQFDLKRWLTMVTNANCSTYFDFNLGERNSWASPKYKQTTLWYFQNVSNQSTALIDRMACRFCAFSPGLKRSVISCVPLTQLPAELPAQTWRSWKIVKLFLLLAECSGIKARIAFKTADSAVKIRQQVRASCMRSEIWREPFVSFHNYRSQWIDRSIDREYFTHTTKHRARHCLVWAK